MSTDLATELLEELIELRDDDVLLATECGIVNQAGSVHGNTVAGIRQHLAHTLLFSFIMFLGFEHEKASAYLHAFILGHVKKGARIFPPCIQLRLHLS